MNKFILRSFFISSALLIYTLSSSILYAGDDRYISLGVTASVPHLIGPEVAFVGLKYIDIGFSYGIFPIDSFLQKKVLIDSIRLGSEFEIKPRSHYDMEGYSYFARIFFPQTKFFFQFSYTNWNLKATVAGDLYSRTLRQTLAEGIVTGEVKIRQKILAIMFGYQFQLYKDSYLFLAGGVTKMSTTNDNIKVHGDYVSWAMFIPNLQSEYDEAKDEVIQEVRGKIYSYKKKIDYLPAVMITLAHEF